MPFWITHNLCHHRGWGECWVAFRATPGVLYYHLLYWVVVDASIGLDRAVFDIDQILVDLAPNVIRIQEYILACGHIADSHAFRSIVFGMITGK